MTVIRIAMWSGPRNLSTTMMRSFGSRCDTSCWDEPFYAPWLLETGIQHPLRDEIIAKYPSDSKEVSRLITNGEVNTPIQYQKHITHHMLDHFPTDFLPACRNAFLIRDPARVIASYANKTEAVSLDTIGLTQQERLFDKVCELTGKIPPVIDTADVLREPERVLTALCHALEIKWDPAMLAWPAGQKEEDGIWGSHWYDKVWQSTGFGKATDIRPNLNADLQGIYKKAVPIFERLASHKLAV